MVPFPVDGHICVTERYTENCTCDKMADLNRGKLFVTVYRKRDHVPQKLIFSYGLQRHLWKTLAKLRFFCS